MKRIICHGTSYEIGRKHGEDTKEQIARSIAFYTRMFMHSCKLEWSAVRIMTDDWTGQIKTKWPRYYEEMQGIADGAEVPFADILALNIRTEIAFGMFDDGCTSLYWRTEAHSFLSQNWDWKEPQRENLILLDIRDYGGGPRIQMMTEAGIIGKIGLNENGVGVCLNAVKVSGCDPSRIPVHLALRLALESSSVDSAVRQLETLGIAASAHILIADGHQGVSVESSSSTIQQLAMKEQDGRLFHCNHLLLKHEGVHDTVYLRDSPIRQQRIQHLAAQHDAKGQEIEATDILRMLDDHDGFPYSICRYAQGPLGIDATLFSILMELRGKTATVLLGRPCQVDETIELDFAGTE